MWNYSLKYLGPFAVNCRRSYAMKRHWYSDKQVPAPMVIPVGKLEKVPGAFFPGSPPCNQTSNTRQDPSPPPRRPPTQGDGSHWFYDHLHKPLRSKSADPGQPPTSLASCWGKLPPCRSSAELKMFSCIRSPNWFWEIQEPMASYPHLHTFHKQ